MRKIPTLFARDEKRKLVIDKVTPGCEWVLEGVGNATRKYDGSCCLVRDGKLFKRYEARVRFATAADPDGVGDRIGVRDGKSEGFVYLSPPPSGFEPATDVDPATLKVQGWVPVGAGPEDRWHREGWQQFIEVENGLNKPCWAHFTTYELVGPKVQGNPEEFDFHCLVPHPYTTYIADPRPRTFESIKGWLASLDVEGIVYYHPDGRLAKIKKRDFGLPRKPEAKV